MADGIFEVSPEPENKRYPVVDAGNYCAIRIDVTKVTFHSACHSFKPLSRRILVEISFSLKASTNGANRNTNN
jgi:hypothetical protein